MIKKPAEDQNEFWSNFSEKYHETLYRDVKEYPSLIVRHNYILNLIDAEKKDYKKVLDIGCGPGEMLIDLMKRGYSVSGIDISEGMIAVAKDNISTKMPGGEFDLKIGDIEKLDIKDESFDVVICAGVIEYLGKDDKALSELNRVLKKDGVLIITVRNKICPARVFDLFSDTVKKSSFGKNILSKFKGAVAGKESSEIIFTPYRKHSPWELDGNLKRFGFDKLDFRYFHFYPFFIPFDKIFPSLFIKLGLKMEKLTNTKLGWLGSGYIVKALKVKNS